jgi:hypothetical protein
MKRIFLILCCAIVVVSCSPKEKVYRSLDMMAAALERGDEEEFAELADEYGEWFAGLGTSRKIKAEEAAMAWGALYPFAYNAIAFKSHQLVRAYEREHPKWFNTEQFMDLIETSDPSMHTKTRNGYSYYYASWTHEYVSASMICIDGDYYISVGLPVIPFLVVPIENAESALVWLDGLYSNLVDLRQQLKDAGLDKVETDITVQVPDMCCIVKERYSSSQAPWCIESVLRIERASIEIDLEREDFDYDDDQITIRFYPGCSFTITDASYHAMRAALKSCYVMRDKFELSR